VQEHAEVSRLARMKAMWMVADDSTRLSFMLFVNGRNNE
jgi:hypothetical protein